jgi:hypothetical protein
VRIFDFIFCNVSVSSKVDRLKREFSKDFRPNIRWSGWGVSDDSKLSVGMVDDGDGFGRVGAMGQLRLRKSTF